MLTDRGGPLAAMMDEYRRAAFELCDVVESVPADIYSATLNPVTSDVDCSSIKNIAMHTIGAAYGYANAIRRALDLPNGQWERIYPEQEMYRSMLLEALDYTEEIFADKWHWTDDDVAALMVPVRWSDRYDLEMLLEHAIVHILRHRRQIERMVAGHSLGRQ